MAGAGDAGPSGTGSGGVLAHAHEDPAARSTTTAAHSRWAHLLARIYDVFPLRCPDCGSDMRILAFLTDPEPVLELDLDQTRGA